MIILAPEVPESLFDFRTRFGFVPTCYCFSFFRRDVTSTPFQTFLFLAVLCHWPCSTVTCRRSIFSLLAQTSAALHPWLLCVSALLRVWVVVIHVPVCTPKMLLQMLNSSEVVPTLPILQTWCSQERCTLDVLIPRGISILKSGWFTSPKDLF